MKVTFFAQGQQHRAQIGERFSIARISEEVGSVVEFGEVMMVEDGEEVSFGSPYLEGFKVRAKVLENYRGKKLRIFKMRRRKKSRVMNGHRSDLTRVQITEVVGSG